MAYSIEGYESILAALAGRGVRFARFSEPPLDGMPRVYLRHDVDLSLGAAVRFARMNAAAGARATFFLLLRSPVYNLLSEPVLSLAAELVANGQSLGLHVAVPTEQHCSKRDLVNLVSADYALARRHLPDLEPVFAWHNTTPELLEAGLDLEVPGLVNAYSTAFFRRIPYHSDTGMRYSVDEWLHLVRETPTRSMQLLFHPELWNGGGRTPGEALARTWPQVIREHEVEFRVNRHYGACFPDGMPESLLTRLADELARLAAAVPHERPT